MKVLVAVTLLVLLGNGIAQDSDVIQVFTCVGFTVTSGKVDPMKETHYHEDFVTVTCNDGYKLIGRSKHTCDEDYGGWDRNRPACVKRQVTCVNPGLEDGFMERPSSTGDIGSPEEVSKNDAIYADDDITFKCHRGFKMHLGASVLPEGQTVTIRCQQNGKFAGDLPTCHKIRVEVTCANPRVRHASTRRWINELAGLEKIIFSDPILAGDELEVQCREGYMMVGPDGLDSDEIYKDEMMTGFECMANGNWNKRFPTCTLFECGQPPLERGLQVDGGTNRTFKHGDRANYKCKRGYELLGPSHLTCRMDLLQWFPHAPTCRMQRCPTLKWPENGHAVNYNDNNLIKIECNEGHELIGSRERRCLNNGSWSDTPAICQRQDSTHRGCQDPGEPDGGYRSGNRFRVGDRVTYRCQQGFTHLGKAQSRCQQDGNWTTPRIRCLGQDEYTDPANAVTRWKDIIQEIEMENQNGGDHHVFMFADTSGSITNAELNAERVFIGNFANQFHHTDMSLAVFNDTAVLLANKTNSYGIIQALRTNTFSSGGGTSVKKALSFVKNGAGTRKSIILILNDGITQGGNLYNILSRRWSGLEKPTVYVITMGGYVKRDDLVMAVSFIQPDMRLALDYVFFLKTKTDLNTLARGIRGEP